MAFAFELAKARVVIFASDFLLLVRHFGQRYLNISSTLVRSTYILVLSLWVHFMDALHRGVYWKSKLLCLGLPV